MLGKISTSQSYYMYKSLSITRLGNFDANLLLKPHPFQLLCRNTWLEYVFLYPN